MLSSTAEIIKAPKILSLPRIEEISLIELGNPINLNNTTDTPSTMPNSQIAIPPNIEHFYGPKHEVDAEIVSNSHYISATDNQERVVEDSKQVVVEDSKQLVAEDSNQLEVEFVRYLTIVTNPCTYILLSGPQSK